MKIRTLKQSEIKNPVFRMGLMKGVSAKDIESLTQIQPETTKDDKAKNVFTFEYNGIQMSCWQYKDSKHFSIWSVDNNLSHWQELFPKAVFLS